MTEPDGVSPLHIDVAQDTFPVCIKLTGELDSSSLGALRAAAEPLVSAHPDQLRVDLAGLTFIDSSGIGYFLHTTKRVRALTLVNPPPFVRDKLRLLGVVSILAMEP
jgi:anti-sigma B factor antagonist